MRIVRIGNRQWKFDPYCSTTCSYRIHMNIAGVRAVGSSYGTKNSSKHAPSNLSNLFPYYVAREGEFILCSEDNWIMINAQVIALLLSFDFGLHFTRPE